MEKDKITTYYSNARELVKQNNPRAARSYVLAILNAAVEEYHRASTILSKAKLQVFLDTWIAVSRELYDKGVTDYVLKCFGLLDKKEQPKRRVPSKQSPKSVVQSPSDDAIDIAGLIDEAAKSQGWCAAVYEKNRTAVVEISATGDGGCSEGTGFIISANGFLLTNDHIVFDEASQGYFKNVRMTFATGSKKSYKLNVVMSDKSNDVALCCFKPEEVNGEFSAVELLKDYSLVVPGSDCLIMGNAFGLGIAPFSGIVRFPINANGNLVYSAPSNPGDSGAPVLNRQGFCIGINKSKTLTVNNVSADGFANATPIDKVNELVEKWCKTSGIVL